MAHPTNEPPRYNGWLVLFGPAFSPRYEELREEARRLKAKLSPEAYRGHLTVKLAAAVFRLVTTIVPRDPDAPRFRLKGNLASFRRARGQGLPPRYRLFWVFSSQHKIIIFLYLNAEGVPRKEDDRRDVYAVFERMVRRGEIGPDFDSAYAAIVQYLRAAYEQPDAGQGEQTSGRA